MSSTIRIGQVINNRYRVDAFIASGGMADVYRVWDLKRNVNLAMKVLHADLAEDETAYKLFLREINALRKLTHPHIVTFYGSGHTDDFDFLLLAFINGPALKAILKNQAGRPLSIQDTLIYLKAISSALGYAHKNSVVHCDVKPGNIMVDVGGSVQLTDFGIVRHADSTTTTIGPAGSPAYMAPEQIRGEPVSAATDIYALGIMLYEMLTNQRPFRGEDRSSSGRSKSENIRAAHLTQTPPDPRSLNAKITPEMAAVMLKALEKDPQDRYQDIMAFFSAFCAAAGVDPEKIPDRLQKFAREPEPVPPQGPTAGDRLVKQSPAKKALPLILGAAGLFIVIIGIFALGDGPIPTPEPTSNPTNTSRVVIDPTQPVMKTLNPAITPTQAPPTQTPTATLASDTQGQWVVYAYNKEQYERDLYLLNIVTGQERTLTSDHGGNIAPTFSPDGSQIAFVACPRTSTTCTLNLMDLNTRGITPISLSVPDVRFPDWCQSPGSSWVAFEMRSKNPSAFNIWRVDVENGDLEQVTDGGTDISPSWSPDCSQIVFERFDPNNESYSDIFIHDLNTGIDRQIFSTPREDEFGVTWSHDGQWIAYSRVSRDTNGDGYVNLNDQVDLYIIRPNGSGETNLTRGQYSVFSPSWSPDSQHIVFTAYYGNDRAEIMIYDLSNGRFSSLGKGVGPFYHTQWSP